MQNLYSVGYLPGQSQVRYLHPTHQWALKVSKRIRNVYSLRNLKLNAYNLFHETVEIVITIGIQSGHSVN